MNKAKSLLLPYMEVKVCTHWSYGYVTCAFYLICACVGSMLQRFCKALCASISTAHKAYLETSVGAVGGVAKKRHSHQGTVEAWDVLLGCAVVQQAYS